MVVNRTRTSDTKDDDKEDNITHRIYKGISSNHFKVPAVCEQIFRMPIHIYFNIFFCCAR